MNRKRSSRTADARHRPARVSSQTSVPLPLTATQRALGVGLVAFALYGALAGRPSWAQTAPGAPYRAIPAYQPPAPGVDLRSPRANSPEFLRAQNQWQGTSARQDPRSYMNAILQRQRMPTLAVPPARSTVPLVPFANTASGAAVRIAAAGAARINIGTSTNQWFPLGPYKRLPAVGAVDQGELPVAGRVNSIDYAKDNSGIFFLATASGGVWKYDPRNVDQLNSTNTALDSRWTHFSDTRFPILETSSVAVDPKDHRIVYVGTGDFNFDGTGAFSGKNGEAFGIGIMKSVNGGATWYNIGNGNPVGAPAGPPIMEGTAVSSIVVDPTNSNHVLATSGRGANGFPGSIWYSTDKGNTWQKGKGAAGGTVPNGDWTTISVSNPDNKTSTLVFYAALENDGVYSSPDGVTWTKLPVPLIFNGTGNGGSSLGLCVVASAVQRPSGTGTSAIARIVYVVDASATKNDGRVFKSVDGGQTWSDITGDITANTGISWYRAHYALSINSSLIPFQGNSPNLGNARTLFADVLSVGNKEFAQSQGGIAPYGPTGPIFNTVSGAAAFNVVTDVGAGPDWMNPVNYFDNVTGNLVPNANTHAFATDPSSYTVANTFVKSILVTDGGAYTGSVTQGFYQIDNQGSLADYNPIDPILDFPVNAPTLNDQLVATQFINADFLQNGDTISVRGATVDNTIASSDTALSPNGNTTAGYNAAYLPAWYSLTTLPADGSPQPSWCLVSYAADNANATAVTSFGTFTTSYNSTTPPVPLTASAPSIDFSSFASMDTVLFDPNDPTGATQVVATSGNQGWPYFNGKSIFYTNSNWQKIPQTGKGSVDVTPDQYNEGGSFDQFHFYNPEVPNDGTWSTWRNEYKPTFGMPFAFDLAPQTSQALPTWSSFGEQPFVMHEVVNVTPANGTGSVLYTGGAFLWRFDPPGSRTYPPQPGPIPPQPVPAATHTVYWPFSTAPNQDHGVWRRVGAQQLADGTDGDHLSAIATNPGSGRVYVGTTGGKVWVTIGNGGNGAFSAVYPTQTLPTLISPWRQIAGPGLGGNTLPNAPVTSISVNPNSSADILVTLGGPAGAGGTGPNGPIPGRVYRCTNALSGNGPTFVNTSGPLSATNFAFLPDVPVNAIARDPDDPFSTFYAATELGVFATIDAGSTWTNATAPLGLPNVNCTSIKVLVDTAQTLPNGSFNPAYGVKTLAVATLGRGAWGFDVTNLSPVINKPNLVITQTTNRTGNQVIVNLKISNQAPTTGGAFGTAYNVLLSGLSLTPNGGTAQSGYISPSNPAGSIVSAANPLKLGTIGQNQTTYVTIYFDGSKFRSGGLAFLKTSGQYTLPPIPPGTPTAFSTTGAFTRLP